MRLAFPLSVVCAFAVVAGVRAAELYEYTDAERAAPKQPIEFSHQMHATQLKMDCLYCHAPAAQGQNATVPAVSVCMGCHTHIASRLEGTPEQLELSKAEIEKLREFYRTGQTIAWVRVHNVPEYAQFKHFRHVQKEVECKTCHGPVEEMNRVYLDPQTVLRPSSLWLPAAKLEMGWCMDCHLRERASDDCSACHY